MRWLGILLLLTAAQAAHAEPEVRKADHSMVVLDFTPQVAADAQAAGSVTALVTAELQKRPGAKLVTSGDVKQVLGVERQRELLGCSEGSSCMAELGGALGTKYIVTGQLARLGGKLLLTASVVDARTARSVARPTVTAESEEELIPASASLASAIADAVGLEPAPAADTRGFNLDLKLGNTLPTLTHQENLSLKTLNLRLDLELGYFVTEQTSPFLGVSLGLANSSSGETLRFIPVLLGVKHYFRPGRWLQPYVGGGVGLGFLAGKLTGDQSTSTSFALTGVTGLAYLPWRHVGFNLEASGNLSGVTVSGSGLLLAFNLDAGVLVLF